MIKFGCKDGDNMITKIVKNSKTERLEDIIKIIKEQDLIRNLNPVSLRKALEQLGPTFIKLGQLLSSHEDVIPVEYCNELKKLRSDVSPMEFSDVEKILKNEYKNYFDIFIDISKYPIGSASMAQVHLATLYNGKKVVVKVQRENIDQQELTDINLFRKVISILHLDLIFKKIGSINEIIDDYETTTIKELDFINEANNIEKFYNNQRDIAYIKVPKVYKNISTSHVLVMEYIDGININNKEILGKYGYDIKEISEKLAVNYIKQAISDGFYHSDPHQDNLMILNGRIVYLDFGMMGSITDSERRLLKACIKKILLNDMYGICDLLLPYSNCDINKREFALNLQKVFNKYLNASLNDIKFRTFFIDFIKILNEYSIILPKNIIALGRGIIVIEGVLLELNPRINLFNVLKGYYKNEFNGMVDEDDFRDSLVNLINSGNNITRLPNELLTFVRSVNDGDAKFNIEFNNSNKQIDKLEVMLHEFLICLLDVALIIGASLIDGKNNLIRNIYLGCIIVLTVWLFIKMYIDHKTKGMK